MELEIVPFIPEFGKEVDLEGSPLIWPGIEVANEDFLTNVVTEPSRERRKH